MPKLGTVTPILRMFDVAKAREFYLDFLGFEVRFEHRFDDNAPLYMGIARDGCELHLSEHHGDGSPCVHIRVEVADIAALHRELTAKKYRYARPGLEETPWRTREVTVGDPFSNQLTFYEDMPDR
ncbi:Glyoxalase/bleomycin resistance protein/dioxygenase [Mesorhizobium plurifarium]|uniref:Bleomycin resistance protein n=1 Tax=Mesorhizobium plurifarium TaxID=69974 RepID=A0A090G0C4_MESPL|nr:Glyoxalase/bleomycin resistance protein/dioxygenase [Mesorhizobium plurifarium]